MSIFNKSAREWTGFLPASRATDPITSHKAEAEINLGPRQKRARMVLNFIKLFPNRTSGEISVLIWRNYSSSLSLRIAAETPHKRLPDLEAMGLVQRGATRKCTDSGKDCLTWAITDKGRRELG